MSGHTPGPWRDVITEDGELVVLRGDGSRIYIGDMETTSGEDHADACLIAAAPELLTQLKNLQWAITQDVMTSYPGVAIEIRATEALIAKAEGRQP